MPPKNLANLNVMILKTVTAADSDRDVGGHLLKAKSLILGSSLY